MSKTTSILLLAGFALLVVLSQSVFTVAETERALLLQLGKPVGESRGPGLHFKLPFVQNVVHLDARILEYEASSAEILTKDKKNMVVDNYARWRITDPLQFYVTLRTPNRALARLDDLIYAEMRVALGQYAMEDIVAGKRNQIMTEVTTKVNEQVKSMGIDIIDVRIKRTDLPPQNEKAIFGRMRAERERQAKLYRSEGQEEAAKLKSGADRERTVILAEAQRQVEVVSGAAEAETTRLFAQALSAAPEYYAFSRSLDAYRRSFGDGTRMVLSPDSPFLRYLKKDKP